jgi:hypothetical protein
MSNYFAEDLFASQHEFRGGLKIYLNYPELTEDNFPIFFNTPVWYRLIKDGCCLDTYAFIKADDRLLVLGQDALIEGRTNLPYFYRSKWHANFDCSLITFNDPSLYDEENRTCGWWQKPGALQLSHELITKLTKKLKIQEEKIVFYGASAGGYYTLASAAAFSRSIIFSDIPQVNLETAPYKDNVQSLKKNYGRINDIFDWWTSSEPINIREINYLQNKRDTKHIKTQMTYFLEKLSKFSEEGQTRINNFQLRIYENNDDSRSHSPLRSDLLIKTLTDKLNSL